MGLGARVGLVVLAAAAHACITEPATQLLVAIDSDFEPGATLGIVDVEVQDAAGLVVYDTATFRLGAPGGLSLPFTFGVAPHGADPAGDVRVVVRGRASPDDPTVRVAAAARSGYRRNRALLLPIVLTRACLDQPPCAAGLACVDGTCAPLPRVDPAGLRDVTGTMYAATPHARVDADAGAEAPCEGGERRCAGRCVDLASDAFHCGACGNACADGSRCAGGTCTFIGGCASPPLPAGASQCVAAYETGVCTEAEVSVRCGAMPDACTTARDGMPARIYSNNWLGDVVTLPRAARRLRFSFGSTDGAYCLLRLLDASGTSLLQPEPKVNCTHPTMPRPGVDVDFTAPAGSAGVTRIWMNHVSRATCYLSAVEATYDP